MIKIRIITKRELRSFFDSLMAYVMIVLFLGFSGFFTWIFGSDIFMVNQASLQAFFAITYRTLFFFIPAITVNQIVAFLTALFIGIFFHLRYHLFPVGHLPGTDGRRPGSLKASHHNLANSFNQEKSGSS